MITNNQLRNQLVKIITERVPNVYGITGGMGIEFGKEKRFFETAQKAAQKKSSVKDKNIYWVPFFIEPKNIIVCGIKSKNNPKEEITLIQGLVSELKFEFFLQKQLDKFIDPKSKFVKSLLESDDFKSFDQAIEKGDIIGVNLRSPQAVVIVEVPGLFKKVHDQNKNKSAEDISLEITKACQNVISSIGKAFKNYDQNIAGCIAPDTFVVLKWAGGEVNTLNTIKFYKEKAEYIRQIVDGETGLRSTTGVGQYYSGLSGLKKSYHDAQNALDLGRKIWGGGRTYHIVDIGMFISLSEKVSYERKAELAYQILGEVIRDKDLYKTMKTFFEMNMNLTDAAKKLHLHRNTLIYRLDKIKRELGLDPRKFSDAVHIKLGLLLYSPNNKRCDNFDKTS